MPLVTIVFTDVVESSATKRDVSLGRDSRERDRAYLEGIQKRHFSLIRECCRAQTGHEVSNMGDAFYLTFDHPVEAVRCATEIQKRLAAEPIDTPRGPLRLRIGIHSGFPESFEGGWHGTDVDTAARVEATATERQILLSSRTYELVRHMTDVKFHPCGEFLLKGVDHVTLWEVDWDGKGPRPTAVPPLSAARRKRQAGLVLALVGVALVAVGAAYRFRGALWPLKTREEPAHISAGRETVAPTTSRAPGSAIKAKTTTEKKDKGQQQARVSDEPKGVAASAGGAAQPANEPRPPAVAEAAGHIPPNAGIAAARVIHYMPRSTVKLEQLIGDMDKERHQPIRSQTLTRYSVEGTDLGYSFEHEGRAYFLFGDTIGHFGRALDSIATSDASDPELGVQLDFLPAAGGRYYLTIQPPGISMGVSEVPVAGISLNGQMYVVVSTNHSENASTDRAVLTKFVAPAKFQVLRTISQLPAGHFIKMAMHAEAGSLAGLPPGGPFVIVWGTGEHRKSDAYVSLIPIAQFESGKGTRYFTGLNEAGAPAWSASEADAKPIPTNGMLEDVSVTWCKDLSLWLMTYDARAPRFGVAFSYSRTPWGPWSEPQILFNIVRDAALGKFLHDPAAQPDDGLAGPVKGQAKGLDASKVPGVAYAPYVVERWTKVRGSELDLYYVLSTRNPYVVVLMKSRLQVQ